MSKRAAKPRGKLSTTGAAGSASPLIDRLLRSARYRLNRMRTQLINRVGWPVLLRAAHRVERLFGVPPPPRITAKAAFVLDMDSGAPIFAKNARFRVPPASLVKLATSILFSRASHGRWDEEVVIEAGDLTRGSTMGLVAGETVTRRDILFGMLGPSGNDAATVAARVIGPDWREQLDRLAGKLSLSRTRFLTPHGRDTAGQRSTAADLARLGAEAFADPTIALAAGSKRHVVNGREIVSTVTMLGEQGVVAGKTGTTRSGRGCLVLAWRRTIIVLLGSELVFDAAGYVRPETDRRYDDARAIIAALETGSI